MNETLNAVRRGEIWIVRNPSPIGREVCKDRPAVIVSSNDVNSSGEGTVLIAWLSESEQHLLEPWTTEVVCSGNVSRALCHKMTAVDQLRLIRKVGDATPEEMGRITDCMMACLGVIALVGSSPASGEVRALKDKVEAAVACNRLLGTRLTEAEQQLQDRQKDAALMENTNQVYWEVIDLLTDKMMGK